MTDEERYAALDELGAKRDAALIEATRQSTLKEINEQNAKAQADAQAAAELAAMKAVATAAREAKTVDYGDPKAARQFDAMYAVIKVDPDNAGKTPTEMVQAAHNAVPALRGIAKAPAKPAEPARRATREVPTTLAGLPNAGQPIVQDELVAQFNALGGDTRKQERFMAGLTASQVDKLVRWADSQVAAR